MSFGIGIYYYLDYLKSFIYVFFLMSAIMSGVIYLNYTTDYKEKVIFLFKE
jgi:hypothetical protein